MNKTLSNFIFIAFICLVFINCANRGNPEGGPKDITPPKIVRSVPDNFSTNFEGKEIKIYFDEYIKIKDLQKQLIISPPMKTQPGVTPLGSASKYITIKIYDTLQPNTTYAFNFGNSITDNNESNPFSYYRYVFSTGDYIDSLTVKGQIVDALKRKPETFVSVVLYEVDSTFNDSIVYKEFPKYVTNTLDSVTTFSIENIKAGKYMLVALKDNNSDNKFQQKTDQIAFYDSIIDVPTDAFYTLKLFTEARDFNAVRPLLISGGKAAFGYEGDYKGMAIKLLSDDIPETFESRVTKDEKADTLYYWYKPKLEVDSLNFNVSHPSGFDKDFTLRIREMKRDSLSIKTEPSSNIGYDEPFKITGTVPFTSFDVSKVSIIDKDSTNISFTTAYDTINNAYTFNFEKTPENTYNIQVLPKALTGFFDVQNDSLAKQDTLRYAVRTRKESDFGYVRFTLLNAKYPIIVQLTDAKDEVKYERFSTKPEVIDFFNIAPGTYYIRTIFDINGNKKYDSGNYLKKIQPEKTSFFKEIEIRADWGQVETLEFKSP